MPTLYPLSSSQQVMYYQMKYSTKKAIINICTGMHFDEEIDPNLMMQAIYLGICRNKSSFTRVRKDGKAIKQYYSESSPEKIMTFDYTDTDEELESDIKRWCETPFPKNSIDTQLYKARFIKKPDGHYMIHFVVSHLAFDAYSLMAMASDILNCYKALMNGEAIAPSKANPLGTMQTEGSYYGSEKFQKDAEFWNDLLESEGEPLYTSFNPYGSKEYKGNTERQGKTMFPLRDKGIYYKKRLSADLVKKVNETAKEIGVSPQVLYLLAVRSWLCKMHNYSSDALILNTVARRATLAQKRAGGTRVIAVYFRMNLDNELSFRDACLVMQDKQNAYYKHSDYPVFFIAKKYRELFNAANMYGYNSINVTYQPYFVAQDDDIPVHFTTYSNGATSSSCYLTIMALDNSGDLIFNYDYQPQFYTEETIDKVHEHITRFLTEATNDPYLKISELMRFKEK